MVIKSRIPTNVRAFTRSYRLPLAATAAFILVVMVLVIGRLHERSALGQVLSFKNSAGQDYATLLSTDKSDGFTKHDIGPDGGVVIGPNGQTTTATNSVSNSASSGQSTPSGTQTVTIVSSTPSPVVSPPSPIPQPFAATIADFSQDQSPSLQCSGPLGTLNLSKCTKTYSFAASVQTTNGPGTVKYGWQYSVSGSTTGSFTAASGTNTASLHNQITLSCKNPATFTAQFVLTGPAAAQSKTLQINHSCP